MKKITLLFAFLSVAISYAQQQQYHLDFEAATASGTVSTWNNSFGGSSAVSIVTNPDPDGTNTSATTKVLRTSITSPSTAENYAGIDNSQSGEAFGTWKMDTSVSSNLTLTMDVHKNYVGTVGIKWATTGSATTFQITDQNVNNTLVDEWQTLSWTLSTPAATLETNISDMIIFIDFTANADRPTNPAEFVLYVDNIKWNAEKLTDAPTPTCSDGFQNGDETGIDCGGTNCAACIQDPTDAPISPLVAAANVIALYSDSYPSNSVTNFNFNVFSGAGVYSEVDFDGNKVGKMENLSYYGAQWDEINVSSYTYVHLNYYATTSSEFNFYLIDKTANIPGGNVAEPRYSIATTGGNEDLIKGEWVGVLIPLSHFTDHDSGSYPYDLTDIHQWKFDGSGTVYFDNIYFTNDATAGVDKNNLLNISVSPSPAANDLRISAQDIIENVTIYNVLGKRVVNATINKKEDVIDVSSLYTGVYILKYTMNNAMGTMKFIKE